MTNERVQPCDKMVIPVYMTYRGNDGLRADHAMFDDSAVICLRWHEDGKDHQRIVWNPKAWVFGKNYFCPEARMWKYGERRG